MNEDAFDPSSDPVEEAVPGWQPQPWWAWTLALLTLGVGALLVAGVQLAGADFGTSLRARGCDASAVPGLVLMLVGCGLMMVGLQCARLQHHDAVFGWEPRAVAFTAPVPIVLALLTLPGVLGCAVASDIASIGLVGDALVGTAGIALAGAAFALVGMALGSIAHVTWQAGGASIVDEPPGIVELAMQEAEALERDRSAQRFHGVDSE